MSQTLSIAEQLQHVTCLIRTDIGTGTGFIYNLSEDEVGTIPALVTNRHVIEGSKEIRFHLTAANNDENADFGNTIEFSLSVDIWKFHPNSEIDLAIAPIGGALQMALDKKKNRSSFHSKVASLRTINTSRIWTPSKT
jgi:hypothetical protein